MIGISKLYCGAVEPGDVLRYHRESGKLPSHLLQFSKDKKPVVVWNMTRRCNLKCIHCYSSSQNRLYPDELTTEEAKAMIADLAAFGAPVLLFSGGEPLMRPDLPELAQFAVDQGMRAVISTNGTLITEEKAKIFREIGLSYVGVSLDGMEATHDRFRGVAGAFEAAMQGIRICREMGIKVGVRFTINRHNVADVPAIFDLLEKEDIPRCCFYHLVYSGRGSKLIEEDLSHAETRELLDLIMDRTRDLFARGIPQGDPHRGQPRRRPLRLSPPPQGGPEAGGGGPGTPQDERGEQLRPRDRLHQLGRRGPSRPVLERDLLRERPEAPLQRDLDGHDEPPAGEAQGQAAACDGDAARPAAGSMSAAGNFRARAEAVTGDIWSPDPACYLTDEEIARNSPIKEE